MRSALAPTGKSHMTAVTLLLLLAGTAIAAEPLDLQGPNASAAWSFDQPTGRLHSDELILDGRRRISRAFYLPAEFEDVSVSAQFLVEPQDQGVLSCGFIVRAVDGQNYIYVHFDRGQAILVRYSASNEWNEINRVSGLNKPAGQWHSAKLECHGDTLRVSLNGTLLYEAADPTLKRGRIGFYGSQGLVHIRNIEIEGQSLEPTAEFHIPGPDYAIVCDDAGAGAYEAFPDVCRLNDGRLMCVFYAGYGHIALPNDRLPRGGRVSYCTSSDEGRTWSEAQVLYDGPEDDRDPSIVQLADGTLLCNFFSLRRTEGSPGYAGAGSWLVRSSDGGTSWSEPQLLSQTYYCSSPIRVLSTGRLILGLYAEGGGTANAAVITSDDQGHTWSREIDIDNGGQRYDAETDVIELKDGSIYAAERAERVNMGWSVSKDGGTTWTVSQSMPFAGHCPYFLRTPDDIILLAHRLPNTSLHYSLDECATWSDNVPIDSVIGAYPSLVNLKDGTVLIVYYEEGDASSIRAKRFRATRTGIEWLPLN